MKNNKIYEANDRMMTLLKDNYDLLQSLGSFGINLGFGDKTVKEICDSNGVDTYTFLAVVNLTINKYFDDNDEHPLSISTLLHYLEASHAYYIDFQLPFIRRELLESIKQDDNLGKLILHLFDDYANEIKSHMNEEKLTVFPYVNSLLEGELSASKDFDLDTYSRNHHEPADKLKELKVLIIKYIPSDPHLNNMLMATLHDIYNNEKWLSLHAMVEEKIFLPTIRRLEMKLRQNNITKNISSMVFKNAIDVSTTLSDREKDVIVALVQGMSNKEIADHLCISINTVITHRRNIARKLQIHSPAGLTIYAIVNGLVDISTIIV